MRSVPVYLLTMTSLACGIANANTGGTALSASANTATQDKKVIAAADTETDDTTTLPTVLVIGERSKDEIGHDDVYEKNISNYYVDREYLDRYRGVSVGDVFAGMNGVYNSDNRNGASLFPNIRGLSGNGRIPVTVDGTVQSLDVWMGMQGINNRNYVDPNMFRSIMVEKGPSMTRGVRSGIGGAVDIRTIDPEDVIQTGRDWGMQVKTGTSSNSISPSLDPHSLVGRDYRDIPGAIAVGPYSVVGPAFLQSVTQRRERGDTRRFNFDDRRVFLASAYQHKYFDVLAAYSDSRRGNYFAGTRGAEDYLQNTGDTTHGTVSNIKNLYPNLARLFAPGWEVPYTGMTMRSLLLKNNWYLPNGHTVKLSFSRNNLNFYELPSVMLSDAIYQTDIDPKYDRSVASSLEYPFPMTQSKTETWKINYLYQPADSRWLDMDISLWRTTSKNRRYHNGDNSFQIQEVDTAWNTWTACNYDARIMYDSGCAGYYGRPAPDKTPDYGQYALFIGSEIQAESVRTGIDFSNRMQLKDNLALTIAADWQFEREEDRVPVGTRVGDVGINFSLYGPHSGRREESNLSAHLAWTVSPRLQISTGVRYGRYKSFDTELYRYRRDKDTSWRGKYTVTGQRIRHQRLVSDTELTMIQAAQDTSDSAARQRAWEQLEAYKKANNLESYSRESSGGDILYWQAYEIVPLVDGKADRSQNPFLNGTLNVHETAENPQGTTGTFAVYKPSLGASQDTYTEYQIEEAADHYRLPEEEREQAWSFMLEAAYKVTENSRVYARYSNMARFASLLESSNTIVFGQAERRIDQKPERNQAFEIGYAYNFTHLSPRLRAADIKLSYYHNTIRNFFDRTTQLSTLQMDRKVMSGLELQGRIDTGKYYAQVGATYRLRQDMCDADYAAELDPHYGRIPECMPGGFFGTLSYLGLQPQYSINLDVGTRLFQQKLLIGARWRYHSESKNKTLDRLMRDYNNPAQMASNGGLYAYGIDRGLIRPHYWTAVSLIDLYAEYHFTPDVMARLSVDNLMDRYYLDPLTRVPSPGAGRTIMFDLSFKF